MDNFETCIEQAHADHLLQKNIISEADHHRINEDIAARNFSVSNELTAFLSVGLILLTTGLGIMIYKNIDRLGHIALIAFLFLMVSFGFYHCFKKHPGFSRDKSESPGIGFDYLLLFTNIMFLTLLQYISWRTEIFGNSGIHYLIGGAFVLFNAYYFDHAGVLSVGLASIATFFGIRLNALELLSFYPSFISLTAFLFGIMIELTGFYLEKKGLKKHFRFTYVQFSIHLFFIASIMLMTEEEYWFLIPFTAAAGFIWYLKYVESRSSFYLSFCTFLYTYILATMTLVRIVNLLHIRDTVLIYLFLLYLGVSGAYGITFMHKLYKKYTR